MTRFVTLTGRMRSLLVVLAALSVVSVDFPDLRTELGCKDKKVVAIRQGRYDVSAFRPGYESVGRNLR